MQQPMELRGVEIVTARCTGCGVEIHWGSLDHFNECPSCSQPWRPVDV